MKNLFPPKPKLPFVNEVANQVRLEDVLGKDLFARAFDLAQLHVDKPTPVIVLGFALKVVDEKLNAVMREMVDEEPNEKTDSPLDTKA